MKKNIFLDFDGTIVNTNSAFIETYNNTYFEHPEFKEADWTKVVNYDFSCQCPFLTKNEIDEIFDSELLFANMEFFPNAYDVIKKLSEEYEIYICSIGTVNNLSNKMKWLEKNLPFVNNYIMLKKEHCSMGKSMVNMSYHSYIIDDHYYNLETSNAVNKICFGQVYDWNKLWDGKRCVDWKEVEKTLLK